MKTATLKQAKKILELAEDLPAEHLQKLLELGLLSDLLNANVDEMMDRMNRNDFRKFCGLIPVFAEFPVWKTIKIGTSFEADETFRQALNNRGFKINDWADDMLENSGVTAASKEVELDLVKATVAELGFKKGTRRDQIYVRAKQFGFEFCPSEVGPQLRLQYQDQLNGEWIFIAMEPMFISDGLLMVFCLGHDDSGLWLRGHDGNPGIFWGPDSQWVFVRPRK